MKQIRILIGLFILGLLLVACGGSDDDSSRFTYKVTGDAAEAAIVYTTETGGREEGERERTEKRKRKGGRGNARGGRGEGKEGKRGRMVRWDIGAPWRRCRIIS